jgi:hypothetical protein
MTIEKRMQRYFRSKARQLIAAADQSVCGHPGLIGSHREEIQRVYLRDILPKRFEVGRGMVYSESDRSREADIVIWDSQNYPCLPMQDHALFFAESVRVVLECKSTWTETEFKDVLSKCRAVRDIAIAGTPNLADDVAQLKQEVASLRRQIPYGGMLIQRHHIGTAAIFLKGGHSLNAEWFAAKDLLNIDDEWPDLLLLLEPGRVFIKNYIPSSAGPFGGCGQLEFYDFGEDALLGFTAALLVLVTERSVQVEDPLYLTQYVPSLIKIDPLYIDFKLSRPVPRRIGLFENNEDQ